MRDVLPHVRQWYGEGYGGRFALATVIDTFRSAPRQPGAAMAVSGDGVVVGSVSGGCVESDVYEVALEVIRTGVPAVRQYGAHGECRRTEVAVFVQALTPPPRMFVFGAIDFAAAVARVGKFLGYHVTVCDARGVFATRVRFPEADEVVVDWPHRYPAGVLEQVDSRTALCVLTHDPKFDVPLLELALRTDAGYIGAGTPEETAISIAAEIIATRNAASARPLSATTGRIHGSV